MRQTAATVATATERHKILRRAEKLEQEAERLEQAVFSET